MMFEFDTAEQREFRNTISKVATDALTDAEKSTAGEAFPRKIFQTLAQNGLTAVAIDEEHGGVASCATTRAIIVEELAATDLGPAIFISVHNMVAGIINTFGSEEQKQKYLPALARGEKLAAFALSESEAGSDAAALRTSATQGTEHYTLNGSKCWITSAGFADLYLVFAKTSPQGGKDGISAFLVENNLKGLSFGKPEKKMGCELSPIATIQFDNVEVPADALLGKVGQGFTIAMSGLAGGRMNIAAAAIGLASGAIDCATKHLQDRKQFGKPLIEFQGLQFMLADMKIQYEAARMLTWRATQSAETSRTINAAIAKCFATDAAMRITTDAVQLLGGAGYVREYRVEKLMRDAKMLQIVEGTNQIQRMIIARELRGK